MNFTISLSGIRVGLLRQDVSANNIANISTSGFKSQRVDQVDISTCGTRVAGIDINFSQGPLELSEGKFSLAINGDGFFRIETPQGEKFTRAGAFQVDSNGNIVTPEGFRLLPNMQIPTDAQNIMVSPNGVVSIQSQDGTINQIGQIVLARFNNPGGLKLEGGNFYSQTPASGEPILGKSGESAFGSIIFGAIEGSNVDLASEIVAQIINSAVVRANIATIRTQDEILGEIIDMKG